MDEEYSKELLFKLISAKSEYEVKDIIDSEPFLIDLSNWRPYGGYEGNFNTINNQAKNSIAALAEKPINSIDALLLKECKIRNLDSKNAPRTMKEAVEVFFGIKSGDFSYNSRVRQIWQKNYRGLCFQRGHWQRRVFHS
ncbi:MAG: hypothetical protein HXY52_03610 [Nitrospirae bacterium]|jgi:hypothetical protein|nr:hypothetical protein [Nitrospirota bacterium]